MRLAFSITLGQDGCPHTSLKGGPLDSNMCLGRLSGVMLWEVKNERSLRDGSGSPCRFIPLKDLRYLHPNAPCNADRLMGGVSSIIVTSDIKMLSQAFLGPCMRS